MVEYDGIKVQAQGTGVIGSAGHDYLVGVGINSFTGGLGSDFFVPSHGTSLAGAITSSTFSDFQVGSDKIGLIGFDEMIDFEPEVVEKSALISKDVSGDYLTDSVGGELVATPTTRKAADAVTVEFSENTSTGATFYLEQPEGYDVKHVPEEVTLIALEEG
ncbi:hypothetical protein [uncultured Sulfitobacter sp.]|uniref:hypothetical protein n=1 Tax=uncultured Sulfitobacter sp. TaxID=191468 RepID=UPI00262DB5B3|nr:hypothetical protein [uncultured Sulfitobacter sp.]